MVIYADSELKIDSIISHLFMKTIINLSSQQFILLLRIYRDTKTNTHNIIVSKTLKECGWCDTNSQGQISVNAF